jgi:hypothetical protein
MSITERKTGAFQIVVCIPFRVLFGAWATLASKVGAFVEQWSKLHCW